MNIDIDQLNASHGSASPEDIIAKALEVGGKDVVVSTNFRPGEAVILYLITRQCPDIPVLWVDHGYNTPDTYRFAEHVIDLLRLNVKLYLPRRSAAHREAVFGPMPGIDEEERHKAFTDEVKLEPFRRGLAELAPSIWFTALRKEQTAFRANSNAFEPAENGVVKVSPILDWTEADLAAYLERHNLPDERTYFDPTKVEGNRECGLHPGLTTAS